MYFFKVNIDNHATAAELKEESAEVTVVTQAEDIVRKIDSAFQNEPYITMDKAEEYISRIIDAVAIKGESLKSVFGAGIANIIIQGWKGFKNAVGQWRFLKKIVSCLSLMITLKNDYIASNSFMEFVSMEFDKAKVYAMEILSICFDVLSPFMCRFAGFGPQGTAIFQLALTLMTKCSNS